MSKFTVCLKENQEFIELGNLLKLVGAIPTGGSAKMFLASKKVFVNGELESRRGRKIHHRDVVVFDDNELVVD